LPPGTSAKPGAWPLLFAPTIGAALAARHHFLWVYCPACRTTRDIDLPHQQQR
jgi:hypothetical protein